MTGNNKIGAAWDVGPGTRSGESKTREIERQDWPAFFDAFSRQHLAWQATVEVLDPEVGAQVEVRNRPLGGITAELRPGREATISLIFGTLPGNLTHRVTRPTRVWLKQSAGGADEALEIESADGPATILRFRSPLPLEMVDGVLERP